MTANPLLLIGLLAIMILLLTGVVILNKRDIEINNKHIEELRKQAEKAGAS